MTDPQIDPLLERALKELRALPPADPRAVSRIVAAAAAARVSPAEDDTPLSTPRRVVPWAWTLGVAAAAAFAGFTLRGSFRSTPESTVASASAPAAQIQTIPVAVGDLDLLPIATAFTLENATANRVSLVGDFNKWNPTSTRLVRQPGTAMWSVVLPIVPGRHMYAFMVDDTILTLDPRAPKAKDPALGVEGSVVMVGKP